ncbi:MAG: hypothetical protein ACI94Y_003852 [Maribacter sp.]|jgi:hypothetical protein
MKNLLIFTSLAFYLVFATSCNTDICKTTDASVYGFVLDAETGDPIPFAKVFVSGDTAQSTKADAKGSYTFIDLDNGNYVLSASSSKYLTEFVNTRLEGDACIKKDIKMNKNTQLSIK